MREHLMPEDRDWTSKSVRYKEGLFLGMLVLIAQFLMDLFPYILVIMISFLLYSFSVYRLVHNLNCCCLVTENEDNRKQSKDLLQIAIIPLVIGIILMIKNIVM